MIYTIKVTRSVLNEDASPLPVVTAKAVYDYAMRNCYERDDMWRESVWMLVLDKKLGVISQYKLSEGGTGESVFDKKVVARIALQFLARGVIIIHNHPSGDCTPSAADIRKTDEIRRALRLFDIELVDHVIIGEGEYFSFNEDKKIKL